MSVAFLMRSMLSLACSALQFCNTAPGENVGVGIGDASTLDGKDDVLVQTGKDLGHRCPTFHFAEFKSASHGVGFFAKIFATRQPEKRPPSPPWQPLQTKSKTKSNHRRQFPRRCWSPSQAITHCAKDASHVVPSPHAQAMSHVPSSSTASVSKLQAMAYVHPEAMESTTPDSLITTRRSTSSREIEVWSPPGHATTRLSTDSDAPRPKCSHRLFWDMYWEPQVTVLDKGIPSTQRVSRSNASGCPCLVKA